MSESNQINILNEKYQKEKLVVNKTNYVVRKFSCIMVRIGVTSTDSSCLVKI